MTISRREAARLNADAERWGPVVKAIGCTADA